jgi:hypothetical protein
MGGGITAPDLADDGVGGEALEDGPEATPEPALPFALFNRCDSVVEAAQDRRHMADAQVGPDRDRGADDQRREQPGRPALGQELEERVDHRFCRRNPGLPPAPAPYQ